MYILQTDPLIGLSMCIFIFLTLSLTSMNLGLCTNMLYFSNASVLLLFPIQSHDTCALKFLGECSHTSMGKHFYMVIHALI